MFWSFIIACQNFLIKFSSVLVLKRQASTNHGIQNNPRTPNINHQRFIWSFTLNHFRSRIARRSTSRFKSFSRFVSIRKTEVNETNWHIMTDKNILELEIPMHDVQFMDVLNSADDLLENLARLIFLHFSLFNNVIEKFTVFNELHYYEKLLWSLNNFVKLDDIRMSDDIQNMNLSRYSLHISYINYFFLQKYLNCDFLSGKHMMSHLYFSECSFAKCFFYNYRWIT